MSTMNRMANAKNQYQTPAKRVLCLCSAGLLRSPTLANHLHQKYGHNTRAAGVSEEYALIPVNKVLLHWADEIVCVNEETHSTLTYLAQAHGWEDELDKPVVVLDLPDVYSWGHGELKAKINEQYQEPVYD